MCHRCKKIVLLQTCMYDCSTSELSCPKEVSITLGNYFGLFGKIWLSIIIGTFCRNLLAIANTYITLHYVPFRIMYMSSNKNSAMDAKSTLNIFDTTIVSKTNAAQHKILICDLFVTNSYYLVLLFVL